MSYQVISRKWRPAAFSEVVGQEHVVRTLMNAVKTGRVGHAYLFSGPRGVGKTTVARILAKCLQCAKGPTPEPCNSCDLCKGVTAGTSVDVLEIDGASNTGVDNIRELRESVKYAPASGKYKIYIIDEVHMLSDSAFNALLKTLEEPPPHVVFIFATTEPHDIPLTIHSRCQRFDFRRVPAKIIQTHLASIAKKEGIDINEDSLYLIIREAEGSLRDAQSILEQVAAFSGTKIGVKQVNEALGLMDRSVIYDLMAALLKKDGSECLSIVESINDFGYDLKKAASELLELTRDLTVLKVSGADASLDVSESEAEKLREFSSLIELDGLQLLFRLLVRGYEDVTRSVTPRYSFEMTLIGACSVGELKPTAELIARLEVIEKRGGGGAAGALNRSRITSDESSKAIPAPVKKEVSEGPKVKKNSSAPPEASTRNVKTGTTVEDLMECLSERSPRLFKNLEQAELSLSDGNLTIRAESESLRFLEIKLDEIKAAAEECFGKRVGVVIEAGSEKNNAKPKASMKPLSKDPVVADALKTFGGKVIKEG